MNGKLKILFLTILLMALFAVVLWKVRPGQTEPDALGATQETQQSRASAAAPAPGSSAAAAGTSASAAAKDDEDTELPGPVTSQESGKVLNIYCWNDLLMTRMEEHYPGYVKVDDTHGTIGDVDVVWTITAAANNAYQDLLDRDLLQNSEADPDSRIDIFLVEADYALKYVDSPYTLPVTALGIRTTELNNQYKYTQDVMTNTEGVLKGVSWQCCPGALIYNREAAIAILGSDDPETVQEAVKDWDAFLETAEKAAGKGYRMTATANDSYPVFSDNLSSPWIKDGTIKVPENIGRWLEDSGKMLEAGQTTSSEVWSAEWSSGFWPKGASTDQTGVPAKDKLDVFCYFGSSWLMDYYMLEDREGSIAANGGWGICEGPQGFYSGGVWIAAATGTDNAELIADIIRKLAADDTIMKQIALEDGDLVNNKHVMDALASDESCGRALLGGQNPIPVFAANAERIDLSNMGPFDYDINEYFRENMKYYLSGLVSYDTALKNFYYDAEMRYPELSH